jgi:integrase
MAGTVRAANLQTPTARNRLKRGRQAHWHTLVPGRAHLGYQRWPDDRCGRWLLRRYAAKRYSVTPLGPADDGGDEGLTFAQAQKRAQELAGAAPTTRLTVRAAMENYIDHLEAQGKQTKGVIGRTAMHILPRLGDIEVANLTSAQIRRWLADLARTPAIMRTAAGSKLNVRTHDPNDDEAVRARRSTANRVLNFLKAALNHAYDEELVASNDAWGRRARPFPNVKAARARYLTVAEAARLLNACPPDLRTLVRGALETGARFGELIRMQCSDFNPDSATVYIGKSKSGKARHVVLTDQGAAFFTSITAGRSGLCFMRNGRPWRKTDHQYPLCHANAAARIVPPITFHGLRHTWASLAVMGGVPLQVVAQNLGHVDTTMVQRHYAHLAPSYVADAIRAGAPRYGSVTTNVKPLKPRKT